MAGRKCEDVYRLKQLSFPIAVAAGLMLWPVGATAQVSGANNGWRYSGADANRSVAAPMPNPRVSGAQFPLPAPPPPAPQMPPDYSKPLGGRALVPPMPDSNYPSFTYRAPTAWAPPAGLSYRRFGTGETLPAAFFAREYWIDHYTRYNLGTAFAGTVWVRVGPDALLVNKDTRAVLDAQYGLFR